MAVADLAADLDVVDLGLADSDVAVLVWVVSVLVWVVSDLVWVLYNKNVPLVSAQGPFFFD